MLERAAIAEVAHLQFEWPVIHRRVIHSIFPVAVLLLRTLAMIRREESAWFDGRSGCTNNLVPAVPVGAPLGADLTALVEKCRVLMHQPMGMELVAVRVTADPDED